MFSLLVVLALSSPLQIHRSLTGFGVNVDGEAGAPSELASFTATLAEKSPSISLSLDLSPLPSPDNQTLITFSLTNNASTPTETNLLVFGKFDASFQSFRATDSGVRVSSVSNRTFTFDFRSAASGYYYGPSTTKSLLLSPSNPVDPVDVGGSLGWSYLRVLVPAFATQTFSASFSLTWERPPDIVKFYNGWGEPVYEALEWETEDTYRAAIWGAAIFVVLSLPNTLMYLCTILCGKRIPAPFWSLVSSYLIHFMYATMGTFCLCWFTEYIGPPQRSYYADLSILIGAMVVAFLAWITFAIWNCWLPNSQWMVIKQLCQKVEESEAGRQKIANNFAFPPAVNLCVEAGHWESREVQVEWESYIVDDYATRTDANGNTYQVKIGWHTEWRIYMIHYSEWEREDRGGGHLGYIPVISGHRLDPPQIERRFVIVWTKTWHFEYGSWDENGEMQVFPNVNVMQVESTYRFKFDDPSRQILDARNRELYREGKTHDTDVTVHENHIVDGFVPKMAVSLNDDVVMPVRKFYASPCGFFLWGLCLLLGYQSAFECRCNLGYSTTDAFCRAAIRSHKDIEQGHGRRARFQAEDEQARALALELFEMAKPGRMETVAA